MTPIEPVKSKFQQEMEALGEKVKEKAENEERITKLFTALREGKLSFTAWKALPEMMQRQYVRQFGKPKTDEEQRAFRKKVAKRRKANKLAKKARARNRAK